MITHPTISKGRSMIQIELMNCPYYWNPLNQVEAEQILDGKCDGTFLIRQSSQHHKKETFFTGNSEDREDDDEEWNKNVLFAVSFRRFNFTMHARVHKCVKHKSEKLCMTFSTHDDPQTKCSSSINELVVNYGPGNECSFLEPYLIHPLLRTECFTLLQLSMAKILDVYRDISNLKIPKSIT